MNNQKGSVLQIVLAIFLIFTNALSIGVIFTNQGKQNALYVQDIMQQNHLEILLVKYYCEQLKNDMLLSDEYESKNIHVKYLVDDMADYYVVTTTIQTHRYHYQFEVSFNAITYNVQDFRYIS